MDRGTAIELLRGLVAIPSLSHHEGDAARWLVDRMSRCGFERAFVDGAGNAVGELGPAAAARTLVLLGHIDTVPGEIPVRIESTARGDVLYGRGSVDAKGPLATFVAAAARLGSGPAHDANLRVVVVGAVEEEAATSKGARFIAARFDGRHEPVPIACVIGEPSGWHRITLGYKGRLLLDLGARQPMAHTAGPDAGVAATVVEIWNRVSAYAAGANAGRDKAFEQLSPSLRRFITGTTREMVDTVEAQVAWRLPHGIDPVELVSAVVAAAAEVVGAAVPRYDGLSVLNGEPVGVEGVRTQLMLRFRGWERPWRADRQNGLVRSLLHAIRSLHPAARPGFLVKTGTSDMNVVGPLWKCPIVAYGPGDSALDHTPHEHVSLDEFWHAVAVMETTLRTIAADR